MLTDCNIYKLCSENLQDPSYSASLYWLHLYHQNQVYQYVYNVWKKKRWKLKKKTTLHSPFLFPFNNTHPVHILTAFHRDILMRFTLFSSSSNWYLRTGSTPEENPSIRHFLQIINPFFNPSHLQDKISTSSFFFKKKTLTHQIYFESNSWEHFLTMTGHRKS